MPVAVDAQVPEDGRRGLRDGVGSGPLREESRQTGLTDPTGCCLLSLLIRQPRHPPEVVSNGISPNGLALLPDKLFLYVAMTRANAVSRLPLHADGTTAEEGGKNLTNCCFGRDDGKTLFISDRSEGNVQCVRWHGAGMEWVKNRAATE
ncbi:uncharacterized protein DSM5745_11119 [Aspergillus mulundensis]|uniref:SMP-30/Gluconolactonase/LRE-like region domain-containing protein n=1 Tax=Aspergillus mulundensis TaxID=1810919 RepID=A0A3D8QAP5_9EURO|nr:hypothetical protein DSM5745_11119 [Aspergillus mulundensis]RDW58913.1 hypothetical protein DSM5745_11119 [Aspergillus mulundensis]